MDGTLLNEEKEVSAGNRAAIKEAQDRGIHVILTTGRSLMTCYEYAKSLALSSYLITVNGSEIWYGNGELIERRLLQAELVEWLWQISQKHKTRTWAVSCKQIWNNEMPEKIIEEEWLKFGFDFDDESAMEVVWQELKNHNELELSNSSPTNIEVNAIGINKAIAVQKVCERLGLTMERVMAVGDSLNDIAMIKAAGLGVAMGNAQETVKEAADKITAANTEDGVAQAIYNWVLNKQK
ncbi:HAD family phosphatase [Bacillaceae bacterium Marseille-Q3522]|nr:HAD family phosphatase [Bacillaceae bacterium Marseille-Q3522]